MGRGKNLHITVPTPQMRGALITESGTKIRRKAYRDGSYERRDQDRRFHREDGPASYSARHKARSYFEHGRLHRLDGPAIEFEDGEGQVWAIDGEVFTFREQWEEARDRWISQNSEK